MKRNSSRLFRATYAWVSTSVLLVACSGVPVVTPGLQNSAAPSLSDSRPPETVASRSTTLPLTKETVWSVVNSPNIISNYGPDDLLYSVSGSSANDVWAVGYDCCVAHGSQDYSNSLIEHWSGSSWSIATDPPDQPADSQLRGVAALSAKNAWAVGYSVFPNQALIEHWNGKKWAVVSSPTIAFSELEAVVALSAKDIWAVGSGNFAPLAEHWDGKIWSVTPIQGSSGGASVLWSVTAASSSDVWAVGEFDHPNANALAVHWNGTSWTEEPVAGKKFFSTLLSGVAAASSNNVWAVGYLRPSTKNQVPQTLVERWNGSRWSVIPSPNMEPKKGYPLTNWLFGVTASSLNDVWAVGLWTSYPGSGTTRSLFEHWDGKAWKTQPGPAALESSNNLAFNQLFGITRVRPGLLWAVGSFFDDSPSEYGDTTLTVQTIHG